jgi:hypothetical protein
VLEHDSLFDEDFKDKMTEQEMEESLQELRTHKYFQEIREEEGFRTNEGGKGGRKRKPVDYSKIGESM